MICRLIVNRDLRDSQMTRRLFHNPNLVRVGGLVAVFPSSTPQVISGEGFKFSLFRGHPLCPCSEAAHTFKGVFARTSTFSTCGGIANNSLARAVNAFAISPVKWALRPASFAKVSKMPNFPGRV